MAPGRPRPTLGAACGRSALSMIPAGFAKVFGTRNTPVEAFHAWKRNGKLKQPFAIARADDAPSAFGGSWPKAE